MPNYKGLVVNTDSGYHLVLNYYHWDKFGHNVLVLLSLTTFNVQHRDIRFCEFYGKHYRPLPPLKQLLESTISQLEVDLWSAESKYIDQISFRLTQAKKLLGEIS